MRRRTRREVLGSGPRQLAALLALSGGVGGCARVLDRPAVGASPPSPLRVGGWREGTFDYNPFVQYVVQAAGKQGVACSLAQGTSVMQLQSWYGDKVVGSPTPRGSAPDVFLIVPSMQAAALWSVGLQAANDAADFAPLAHKLNIDLRMFDAGALRACRLYGRLPTMAPLAGLPIVVDPLVLAISRSLLARAGIVPGAWSFEEFFTHCQAVRERVPDLVAPIGGGIDDALTASVIGAHGGSLLDLSTATVTLASSDVAAAIRDIWNIASRQRPTMPLPQVQKATAAFEFQWLSEVLLSARTNTDLDFVPVPHARLQAAAITGLAFAVARSARDPLAAARFVQWATDLPATSVLLSRDGLGLPARRNLGRGTPTGAGGLSGLRLLTDGWATQVRLPLQEFFGGSYRFGVVSPLMTFITGSAGRVSDDTALMLQLHSLQQQVQAQVNDIKVWVSRYGNQAY